MAILSATLQELRNDGLTQKDFKPHIAVGCMIKKCWNYADYEAKDTEWGIAYICEEHFNDLEIKKEKDK